LIINNLRDNGDCFPRFASPKFNSSFSGQERRRELKWTQALYQQGSIRTVPRARGLDWEAHLKARGISGLKTGWLGRNKRGPGGPRYSRPGGRRYSFISRESVTAVGD
jgi:hypothetical protein